MRTTLTLLFLALWTVACGDDGHTVVVRRYYGGTPTAPTTPQTPPTPVPAPPKPATPQRIITLFIEAHPALNEDLIVAGCEYWANESGFTSGIDRCARVYDERNADARIYAQKDSCYDGKDDGILGWAFEDGFKLFLWVDCLKRYGTDDAGRQDPRMLIETVTHELGHLLGIWAHVPGEQGKAIMNPYMDGYYDRLTTLDQAAYRTRDPGASILPTTSGAGFRAGPAHNCALKVH